MCTSIVSNRKRTIVGWNLDLLQMEHRIRETADGVYIEVNDKTEVCPTVVPMVLDASENMVYWCENRDWDHIHQRKL